MEGFSKISRNLSPADFTLLENFVCEIYGSKEEDINLTRFELYKKGALPSLMPPNKDCLELHCMRSAYQASVWTDLGNQLDMDAAIGFGWEIVDGQLEILWRRKEEAPADIQKVGDVTVYNIYFTDSVSGYNLYFTDTVSSYNNYFTDTVSVYNI